jgi:hypothetical protein
MSVSSINTALSADPPADHRRQFYFLPGTYGDPNQTPDTATTSNTIQAQVASGTQVAGLGAGPCDVVINGALSINSGSLAIRPSQIMNLTINPIQSGVPAHSMLWYTSQTATIRRVNLLGNLYVSQVTPFPGGCQNPCDPVTQGFQINIIPGVANGFVIANSNITGNVINNDGLNRPGVEGYGGNSDIYYQADNIGGTYTGFGSDMVFAGTIGAPPDDFGPGTVSPYSPPGHVVTVDRVPVIRDSPWVYYDGSEFQVFRPSAQFDVRGPDWSIAADKGDSLPLSSFHIATIAAGDTATTMNDALASGKNLLIGPGTFVLDAPITVTHPDQVIFGLGNTILRADDTSTIVVKDSAPGAVLAGFNADGRAFDPTDMGPFADYQIVIGDTPHGTGSKTDPTTLSDVSSISGAETLYLLNQDHTILNQGQIQTNNNSGNGYTTTNWTAASGTYGAVVNGDHVTWQGIWLEHFKKAQITWNGEDGNVLFLQNERPLTVPYDMPDEFGVQPHVWKMRADFDGYPSLAISPSVDRFTLHGFQSWSRLGNGCYCNVTSVVTAPVKPGVTMHGLFTGEILGSVSPSNATPTGATVGGAFNLVNNDGVSASVPYSTGPWGATSAWPYSDLAGHGATARRRDFPTQAELAAAGYGGGGDSGGGSTSGGGTTNPPADTTPPPTSTPAPVPPPQSAPQADAPKPTPTPPAVERTPVIKARFRVGRKSTRVTGLWLRDLPKGSMVTVRCKGKHKGCAFRKQTAEATDATMSLAVLFKSRKLKPGARIVVTVKTPQGKVKKVTYKVRHHKPPKRS